MLAQLPLVQEVLLSLFSLGIFIPVQLSTTTLQLQIYFIVFNVLVGKKGFEPLTDGFVDRFLILAGILAYEW